MRVGHKGEVVVGIETEVQRTQVVGNRGATVIDPGKYLTHFGDHNLVVGAPDANRRKVGNACLVVLPVLFTDGAGNGAKTALDQLDRRAVSCRVFGEFIGDDGELGGFLERDHRIVHHADLGGSARGGEQGIADVDLITAAQGAVDATGIPGSNIALNEDDATRRFAGIGVGFALGDRIQGGESEGQREKADHESFVITLPGIVLVSAVALHDLLS